MRSNMTIAALSQGGQANANGKQLESSVESILDSYNFDYISQAPYENIYGSKRARIDFRIDDLAIECKFQRVAGSVSEKMPYVVANLGKFPRGLLVIDGDYFRKNEGLQAWLSSERSDAFDWCFVEELGQWLEESL